MFPTEAVLSRLRRRGRRCSLPSNVTTVCTSNNAVGNAQNLNFAPRLGFSYRAAPQIVVRGGSGITYGALDNTGFGYNIGGNYPFAYTVSY